MCKHALKGDQCAGHLQLAEVKYIFLVWYIDDDIVVYHRARRGQHRYLRPQLHILYWGGQTSQAETVNG